MIMEVIPDVQTLAAIAQNKFKSEFGKPGNIIVAAPGRVNLIGEHTDYNEGFVLPMALPLVTIIVGSFTTDNISTILTISTLKNESSKVEFSQGNYKKKNGWSSYVQGIIAHFHGVIKSNFQAVFVSSVPLGAGLSSSASLEVAMYTFLEVLTSSKATSLTEKIIACQKAEHEYAGVPCGIMDQFISVLGQENNALLIDCRSLTSSFVFISPTVSFLIINSHVKHQLMNGEYEIRRQECEMAAKLLNKKYLRDVSMTDLENKKNFLSDIYYKRAKHVISENERTVLGSKALSASDFITFGHYMNQSHRSLKNDFEVSCKEIDDLVNATIHFPGVYGTRMTGGGFGGCTVTAIQTEKIETFIEDLAKKTFKIKPSVYVCRPSQGSFVISSP